MSKSAFSTRRARFAAGLFGVAVLVGTCLIGSCTREPYKYRPFALSDGERDYLMGVAREALQQYFRDGTELRPKDPPATLRRHQKRVVFATFHLDGETRGCVSANESDLATNVVKAVVRTANDDRYFLKGVSGPTGKGVTLRPAEIARVRIELNVLGNYERLPFNDADSLRGEVEPGVQGVRIAQGKKGAYYLPYVGIEFEYDMAPYLRTLAYKAGLPKDSWHKTAALWRFEADNFVEAEAGGKVLRLYRWNVLAGEPTAESLRLAIERGSRFVRASLADPKRGLGWHPKRKAGLGEAPTWLQRRALAVADEVKGAPPPAKAKAKSAATSPAKATATAATTSDGAPSAATAASPTPRHLAADLAYACMAGPPSAQGVRPAIIAPCTKLAALVRKDGTLEPAARAPISAVEREHADVIATIRALATLRPDAKVGKAMSVDVAKRAFVAAEKLYGDRLHAKADLAVAALVLRAADPEGGWLVRARAHAERLLAFQWMEATAPTPDQRGAFNLGRAPETGEVARAALAFAMLAAAGESRFREPALRAAQFLLTLQFRPENVFAFPKIDRYEGGVRVDLHHVSASVESTLDAIEAWRALGAVFR